MRPRQFTRWDGKGFPGDGIHAQLQIGSTRTCWRGHMGEDPEGTDGHEDGSGALSAIGDTLGDLVSGIPAPIRKNAIKAFARLCTAAVEYPIALIEGAIAEKRAV